MISTFTSSLNWYRRVQVIVFAAPMWSNCEKLSKDASQRRFDLVMAWSIDRIGRSLSHVLATIQHLVEAVGVDLYLDQQHIDSTTPTGRLPFQVTGAFAEFERSMIRARVNAGLARARAQGKCLGRRPVSGDVVERIQAQAGEWRRYSQNCEDAQRRDRNRPQDTAGNDGHSGLTGPNARRTPANAGSGTKVGAQFEQWRAEKGPDGKPGDGSPSGNTRAVGVGE